MHLWRHLPYALRHGPVRSANPCLHGCSEVQGFGRPKLRGLAQGFQTRRRLAGLFDEGVDAGAKSVLRFDKILQRIKGFVGNGVLGELTDWNPGQSPGSCVTVFCSMGHGIITGAPRKNTGARYLALDSVQGISFQAGQATGPIHGYARHLLHARTSILQIMQCSRGWLSGIRPGTLGSSVGLDRRGR